METGANFDCVCNPAPRVGCFLPIEAARHSGLSFAARALNTRNTQACRTSSQDDAPENFEQCFLSFRCTNDTVRQSNMTQDMSFVLSRTAAVRLQRWPRDHACSIENASGVRKVVTMDAVPIEVDTNTKSNDALIIVSISIRANIRRWRE